MRAGDILWTAVDRLLAAAAREGIDPGQLQAMLPPPALREERFELLDYCRLGQYAISLSGRGRLGLVIAAETRFTHLGLAGLAAASAPTLGDALQVMTRFEPLSVRSYRGQSRWLPTEDKLAFYSIAPYNDYTRFIVDAILATWVRIIGECAGTEALKEVRMEFSAPAYHADYAAAFPCPVYFAADENAVLLTRNAAARPLHTSEPLLHAELLALCEQRLRQLENESRLHARVQKVLGPMLRGNTPSLDAVADGLGMASWTLRRKLREEGTSFQTLLDDSRRDLALAYMKDVGLSLGEIAYILGFSTPGAFQRAFKRWTGVTPGEYRRQRRDPKT
ncbi:MAG: AraC family transcriptional regulator ligand-binding domain-containing protein [Pseudomonadota bacterium]